MRKIILVFFLFCFSSFSIAQTIGEIFDKDFADQEFGQVVTFVEVESKELTDLLKLSGQYIMLNIDSGNLRAIDADRKSVAGLAIFPEEIFYNMSTSQVKLLIKNGGRKTTKVEMRPKTLTLTNGNFTLEMIRPCPPYCL